MVALVVCLFFFFLLPCFSNSCTPTFPCNHSIQIKPPFFLQSDILNNPTCLSRISVGCDARNMSYILWHSFSFPLESISYDSNIIRIQDPYLNSSLKESGCSNLFFNFNTPIKDFDHRIYKPFNTSLFSLKCEAPNQIHMPPKIFGEDYNLSYSPFDEDDKYKQQNCLRPDHSIPSFEFTLSFENDSRELSLLSATYSYDLAAKPGCFASSTKVLNCKNCKEKRFRRRIILGLTVGPASLLAICSLSFFFYKRRKLKSASSLSKLLTRRESSDQYFHDLEMAALEYTQVFSYEELKEATEGFSESNELGDGGFGTVYKGILKDRRVVAVKRLYKNNYKKAEQFMNEVAILSRLNHPNLVTLYGCTALTSPELLLVFEYVPNGTIADHLHGPRSSKNALTWPVRLSIAIETANALAYLHAVEPPIIHRDVKTNNILLDDNFHVKVGDFGLSRLFPLDVTHVSTVPQGTPGYVDPVYHQCYHLTDKSDVYSFGVVLVELISSKQAVDLNRSNDEINLANMALNKIQRSQLDDLVDPDLGFKTNSDIRKMISLVAELAFRCLQSDRDMRPSIKEVLEALRVIEKGNFSDNKMKENMTKEETYLLKFDTNSSPDTMINSWNSCSTTPNTSG